MDRLNGYCIYCGKFTYLVYLSICVPCFEESSRKIRKKIKDREEQQDT